MLILLTAVFSYAVVHQNRTHLTSHFVVEMARILFRGSGADVPALGRHIEVARNTNAADPVGAGVRDLLSAPTPARTRSAIFFRTWKPNLLRWFPPLVGVWLPLAWAYTFTQIQEDARLEPARLMVRAR